MPAPPSSNPAQFVQGAPVLHVANVETTAAFYRDVLGFTWDFGDETYAGNWVSATSMVSGLCSARRALRPRIQVRA
jgi:hypothetical protein